MNETLQRGERFNQKHANLVLMLFVLSGIAASVLVTILSLIDAQTFSEFSTAFGIFLEVALYLFLCAVVFRFRVDIKTSLSLNWFNIKEFLLMVLATLLVYITAAIFGYIAQVIFSSLGGEVIVPPGIEELLNSPVWLSVFALCVVAPVFEEFFFRGVILGGYTARYGIVKASVFSGLLFALMHAYFPSVIAIIPVGIVFGLMVGYSGSIFLGVLAHGIYNALAYTQLIDDVLDLPVHLFEGQLGESLTLLWMLILLPVCVFGLIFIINYFKKHARQTASITTARTSDRGTVFFVLAIVILGIESLLYTYMYLW